MSSAPSTPSPRVSPFRDEEEQGQEEGEEGNEAKKARWLFMTNTRTTSLKTEADHAAAVEFATKFKDCKRSEMTAAIDEAKQVWQQNMGSREDALKLVANLWTPEEVHEAFERRCQALEWPAEIQKKPYCTFVRPQTPEDDAVAAEIISSIDPFLQSNKIVPAVSQKQFLCFLQSKNFFAVRTNDIDSGILCCDEQGGGKTFQALFTLLNLWKILDPSLTPKGNDTGKQIFFKRPPGQRPMLVVASKMTLPTWMTEVSRLDVPFNLFVFIESGNTDADNARRVQAFESAGVIITTKSALSTDFGSMFGNQGRRDKKTSLAQFPGPRWECILVDEVDSVCSDRVSYPPMQAADGSWSPINPHEPRQRGAYKREFNALLWAMYGCPRRLVMTGTPWLSNDPAGKICCIMLLAWPLRAFVKDPMFAARIVPYRGAENTFATMLYQQRTDVVQWFQRNFVIGRTLNQVRAASRRGPISRQMIYLPVHCSPTEHEILKSLETRTARAIENALATTVVVTAGAKRIKTEQMTANELASMEFFTHLMRLRERTELNAHYSEAVHSFREKHPNDPIPNELVAAVPLSNKEIALITLLKHVCKHPGRKVLLYTDFIATNTRIAHILNTFVPEMASFMLHSTMKPGARQVVIDGFNSWKGNAIFFSNIKCGERGINLQAADMTIFLSSQYNPSAEAQAMYRNARLSTEHELVTVVYLSMDSTIQGWMSNIGADKLVRSMEIGCDDDPDDSINRKRGLDGKLKTKQVVEAHKARQFAMDVVGFAEKRTPRSQPDPLVGLCNCGEDLRAEMAAFIQRVSCAGNSAGRAS